MTVTPLRPNDLTPQIMLESAIKDAHECRAAYLVMIGTDGYPRAWTCGELTDMTFAVAVLQDLVSKYLNDAVVYEGGAS